MSWEVVVGLFAGILSMMNVFPNKRNFWRWFYDLCKETIIRFNNQTPYKET
jgi:hypothetical protein